MRIASIPELDRRAAPPAQRPARRRPTSWRVRIVQWLAWSVVGLCVAGYAASLAVPLWFQLNQQRLLIVTSGSMSPYFDAGDAVVMRQITDPSQLRVGQVASFWPPGSELLITHRIIELKMLPVLQQDEATGRMVPTLDPATGKPAERPYILTKGDANAKPDANATPLSRVRGVVLVVHPRWGAVLDWAHSPIGRLLMLSPPLAILAAMEIAAVVQARRAQPRKPAAAPERAVVDDLLLG